ncbi:LysR family transcriptional regulator [Vibrio sp. WXL210]|uniref:LysR family transcriptional regulator n=1 Tax=Vibrio sp. WXL210 TaxID=3450709 RepID=UPI003EC5D3B6
MVDLNLIRIFIATYQLGSYTKAAEKLEVSQPAVSSSIKRLEKHIGYKLFAKNGRGIEPTYQAKMLATELEAGLIKIDQALAPNKELSIYCSEAMLHFLGDVDNTLFLPSLESLEMELEHLRKNIVDIVIGVTTSTDPAFIVEKIAQDKLVVVCRKLHPRLEGNTLSKEQFFNEQWVTYRARNAGVKLIDLYTKDCLHRQRGRVEASSMASVLTMVLSSDYLGVVTESFAKHWKKAMNFNVFEYPFESHPVTFQLIYHKRDKSNPQHMATRSAIKLRLKNTV